MFWTKIDNLRKGMDTENAMPPLLKPRDLVPALD